jgi:hypothetical protein
MIKPAEPAVAPNALLREVVVALALPLATLIGLSPPVSLAAGMIAPNMRRACGGGCL